MQPRVGREVRRSGRLDVPRSVRCLIAASQARVAPLILLAIAGTASGAEVPPIVLPPPPPPCDETLARQIAVQGLAADLLVYPLSNPTIPAMGFATTDMSSAIDAAVGNYMNQSGMPGGAVAMTYDDKLIFAKAYGYADVGAAPLAEPDTRLFAEPDSRLRIASVSKAITAMGILKLVHDQIPLGKIGDDPNFPLNYQPFLPPAFGKAVGGRLQKWIQPATVDDLLHHAGGWVEDYENYSWLSTVEGVLKSDGPPNCATLLRYVEARPKSPGGYPNGDFTPGTHTAYSNVGFCALSEAIHRLAGTSYIDFVRKNVFQPLAMNDTQLGTTQQPLDREVVNYPCGYFAGLTAPVSGGVCGYGTPPASIEGPSLFAPHATLSASYGGGVNAYSLEASEGAGGFVSTTIDLARFTGAIASGHLPNFPGGGLTPGWPQKFYSYTAEQPSYEAGVPSGWFGMGWDEIEPHPVTTPFLAYDNYNFIKSGGFPGTVSGVATTGDGYSFAAVFNGDRGNDSTSPVDGIFWPTALPAAYAHEAAFADAAKAWNFNFFPQYSQDYSAWMTGAEFAAYLTKQAGLGFYPTRLEGTALTFAIPVLHTVLEYRARFGPLPASAHSTPPQYKYGLSCTQALGDIRSAPANTPLVSLQRFFDRGTAVYQAVWSTPIPQLPSP